MKRFLALALALVLLWPASPGRAEGASPALYTARTRVDSKVYADWDGTEGITQIGIIPKSRRISARPSRPYP